MMTRWRPMAACGAGAAACFALFLWVARPGGVAKPAAAAPVAPEPQCGHWAIYRACQMLGVPVSVEQAMRLMPPREGGHSFLMLTDALRRAGLDAEGREETLPAVAAASPQPVIAHFTPDHLVVVVAVREGRVVMYDGVGRRKVWPAAEFQKRWTGRTLRVRRAPGTATPTARGPSVKFDTLLMDKGEVPAVGEPVSFAYTFRNVGDAPLLVESVKTDCKCMGYTKPDEPVAPGGSGTITLKYSVRPEGGSFSHAALVTTNDPATPAVRLTAAGNADTRVQAVPSRIDFGTVVAGTSHSRIFRVSSSGDDQFEIGSLAAVVPPVRLSFRTAASDDLKDRVRAADGKPRTLANTRVVQADLRTEPGTAGQFDGSIEIGTNVAGFERLTVPVRVHVVPPVIAAPETLYLGEPPPGQLVTQTVTLASFGDRPFRVKSVKCGTHDLACSFPDAEGTRAAVKVEGKAAQWDGAEIVVDVRMSSPPEPITLRIPVYVKISPPSGT